MDRSARYYVDRHFTRQTDTGLNLNISEQNNELDLGLAREVAEKFRVNSVKRELIIDEVTKAVSDWKEVAGTIGISRSEILSMESAFLN